MKVKDFMTPNPQTIHPDSGVKTAFRIMKKGNFRQLPVVEDDRLVGIITDRDIRRPDFADDLESWDNLYRLDDSFQVRSLMTPDVITVKEDDDLEKACSILYKHKFNALPVVSGSGVLVGIITLHDLLEPLMSFLGEK